MNARTDNLDEMFDAEVAGLAQSKVAARRDSIIAGNGEAAAALHGDVADFMICCPLNEILFDKPAPYSAHAALRDLLECLMYDAAEVVAIKEVESGHKDSRAEAEIERLHAGPP